MCGKREQPDLAEKRKGLYTTIRDVVFFCMPDQGVLRDGRWGG